MQVTFTKQKNCNYSVIVNRDDYVKLQFIGVGKKFLIPHDLSHFIVESQLNMCQGFWGCVANGALFPGMNIVEGRQKPHAKSKSKQIIKAANRQLTLAECLVRVFDEVYTLKSDRILQSARNRLREISVKIEPNKLSDVTVLDICSTLKTFQSNWQTMDIAKSIEVNWNQKLPSKSLNTDD